LLLHFIPHEERNLLFLAEGGETKPPSPSFNSLRSGDEAAMSSELLRALGLWPEGSILVEQALVEISP
jgi:hypothetical protein